jgi:type III secretion system YopN/LcrE/InvE/MxiC family regulator
MADIRSPGNPGPATLAKTTAELANENVAKVAQVASGHFNGEQVNIVKDAVRLANDMAHEVGTLFSEDMERELSQEGRRIVRQEPTLTAPGSMSEAGDHIHRPVDLLARKDEIEALGRAMQAAGLTDPGDIIEFLRNNLGERPGRSGGNNDPTLQYGALVIIQEVFAAEGQQAMAEAVGAAATRLLAEHALEIQKGMIVTDAAILYASERFGSVSNLRSLYMDQVVAHKGIPATYNSILEKYGDAGFADAVGFLLAAASDDLAKMTVDIDRARQKDVLDNLYQLEVLNTVRERTDDLLQQIGKHYPVAPDATPLKVMRQTFELIQNPGNVTQSTISRIARETVPESVEGRISFLREYRGLASMVPLKIFDQAEQSGAGVRLRERLTDAIVAAQDDADAEEAKKLGS